MKERVYLGLGGNVGPVKENLARAIQLLDEHPEIEVVGRSKWYLSSPVGKEDQPWFINGVIEIYTTLKPEQLLKVVNEIEQKLGRQRRERWGPRTVDIDILLFGDQIINTEDLVIPHPRLKERSFVLVPLRELNSRLTLPTGEQVEELIEKLEFSEQQVLPINLKHDKI
ncbi:2-amino-4-hydroxy-6-hydroxymethyldihydropteridine diphosphokinase [Calderihabitans maritimus]|uniref:2-amino-4-hydroxy-6-hydroxymethyldihydropteridine diphosphokinase n=1 Tax=Calderihabitans maritimus TaxID=1246530 RepID=A0A1Z5HRQ7_9FIRM|nr:2-amino-4-hydroxy-6-hydroxymethyldihydropteridine diphosphokinase [Calderihabitans maritimus]GAW92213.1 7,8-dihydro-6-hydroxymethylpterin-pyrophosphokinase [Calderihabitans maritimus]